MSSMRELLEKCKRLCLVSNSTNEFTKEERVELICEIEAELAKTEPEPLSTEEINSLWINNHNRFDFARAIEQVHGITSHE